MVSESNLPANVEESGALIGAIDDLNEIFSEAEYQFRLLQIIEERAARRARVSIRSAAAVSLIALTFLIIELFVNPNPRQPASWSFELLFNVVSLVTGLIVAGLSYRSNRAEVQRDIAEAEITRLRSAVENARRDIAARHENAPA